MLLIPITLFLVCVYKNPEVEGGLLVLEITYVYTGRRVFGRRDGRGTWDLEDLRLTNDPFLWRPT